MKKPCRIVWLFTLISFLPATAPCEESAAPEPYQEDEFPAAMNDLRRAEIITLGAVPFVTLNVTIAYSLGNCAFHGFDTDYLNNPFAKSSSSYTTGEQVGILLTSLGISLGIGLTDFIVRLVRRRSADRRAGALPSGRVNITPLSEDPDAVPVRPEPRPETPDADADADTPEAAERRAGRPLPVNSDGGPHGAE